MEMAVKPVPQVHDHPLFHPDYQKTLRIPKEILHQKDQEDQDAESPQRLQMSFPHNQPVESVLELLGQKHHQAFLGLVSRTFFRFVQSRLGDLARLGEKYFGEGNYHGDREAAHSGKKHHEDHGGDQVPQMRLQIAQQSEVLFHLIILASLPNSPSP